MILDTGPSPMKLYQRLSRPLPQLPFPAGLRGRCSRPHFTVEILEAQGTEVTFARLQRKSVAALALNPRSPMSCLKALSSFLALSPCPSSHNPPTSHPDLHPTVSQQRLRSESHSISTKGGTRDYFLATMYVGGINIRPGAAEIRSTGTEAGEKGTDQICLQWANPASAAVLHWPGCMSREKV